MPHGAMAQIFEAQASNDLPEVPDYNVCPTVDVHAVTGGAGARRLRPMRWGFVPHWYDGPSGGPLLINARAETLAEKPAFRRAARESRCLVVASGFYEWHRRPGETPLPWYVTRQDGAPMAFAGVWREVWHDGANLATVAIVTCAANEDIAPIHHRLPVILGPADWPLWLGEAGHGAARLMRPCAEGALSFRRVGAEVNSSRAKGPGLIAPLDADCQ